LLIRIETDPAFLKRLTRAIARRAPLFQPAREKAVWKSLIEEMMLKSLPARSTSRRSRRLASRPGRIRVKPAFRP
jgi:hypothetical protein